MNPSTVTADHGQESTKRKVFGSNLTKVAYDVAAARKEGEGETKSDSGKRAAGLPREAGKQPGEKGPKGRERSGAGNLGGARPPQYSPRHKGWRNRIWLFWRSSIIHPESTFRFKWTMLLALFLLYISIAVPLQMGFRLDPSVHSCTAGQEENHGFCIWAIWDYVCDVFFLFDLAVNLLTGFVNDDGNVELNPTLAAKNYIFSAWFPIDFITSIPFDWIRDIMGGDSNNLENLKMVKVFRALKAMKVLRINRLLRGSILDSLEDLVMQHANYRFALKLSKLMVGMIFAFHWCSCFLHMLANPTTDNWIKRYLTNYLEDIDNDMEWYESKMNTDNMPLGPRYLAALYWTCSTMATVGFGDIVPVNNTERMGTFAMVIVGCTLYGFMIGNMNSIVHDVDANTRQYNMRMESIVSYMVSRRFPKEVQRKIIRFYRRYFKTRSALDEKTVLAELSTKLKAEVAHFLIDGLVFKNPVFSDLSPTQLATLTTVLQPIYFEADDYLVREGDVVTDIHIIAAGQAMLMDDKGERLLMLNHGSSFGEEAIICDASDEAPTWRLTVNAVTVCESMMVPVSDLRNAFSQGQGGQALQMMKAKLESLSTEEPHKQTLGQRFNMTTVAEIKAKKKSGLRSKFMSAVKKQVIIGQLGKEGKHTIKMRPGETPEELLKRTIEMQSRGMSAEDLSKSSHEKISRVEDSIKQLKSQQMEMYALIQKILDKDKDKQAGT